MANDPQITIDFLTYAAVSLSIQLNHERIYRMIYGSQMQAMLRMNQIGGVNQTILQEIYNAAMAAFPNMYPSQSTFEQWLGFLVNSGLVVGAPNQSYQLTASGRGFLRYILDNRLSPEKFY